MKIFVAISILILLANHVVSLQNGRKTPIGIQKMRNTTRRRYKEEPDFDADLGMKTISSKLGFDEDKIWRVVEYDKTDKSLNLMAVVDIDANSTSCTQAVHDLNEQICTATLLEQKSIVNKRTLQVQSFEDYAIGQKITTYISFEYDFNDDYVTFSSPEDSPGAFETRGFYNTYEHPDAAMRGCSRMVFSSKMFLPRWMPVYIVSGFMKKEISERLKQIKALAESNGLEGVSDSDGPDVE